MSLKALQLDFIEKLREVYNPEEAENIWYLVIENLTGMNLRSHHTHHFIPDGCFLKMLGEIRGRLLQQEPIQYILNEAWFYDAAFYVNKEVLIPRPETEELVDWVLKENKLNDPLTIIDVGTGSGCIPVILKNKIPQASVISCDLSATAIHIATKNARRHKVEIRFMELDFLNPEDRMQLPLADILVSNPPYIPEGDQPDMRANVVEYEPHLALFVKDSSPLIFYEALAEAGMSLLHPGGSIYAEIHEKMGTSIRRLFEDAGYETLIRKDLQGKDRMIRCQKPG